MGTGLSRTFVGGLLLSTLAFAAVLLMLPAPAAAGAALAHLLRGNATVARAALPPAPLVDEELVANGDVVTTAEEGYVLLGFLDGSTLSIDPLTSVTVLEASARPGATIVRIAQSAGRTWSSVRRLLSSASRYEIITPAVTASVRGTAFEVLVAADGTTVVRSYEGTVFVANALGEVVLGPGTETTATPSTAPSAPAPIPPTSKRVVEIGDASVAIVDEQGRSCGRVNGVVTQQIPGCVVGDGTIEMALEETDTPVVAVATGGSEGAVASVSESVVAPDGGSTESVREIAVGSVADVDITVLAAAPPPAPTIEVDLPLIGTVPVQFVLTTPEPTFALPSASPPLVPVFTLPPVPTLEPLVSAPPTLAPSLQPSASVPVLPTVSAPPLPTVSAPPLPTVEVASPIPSPTLTVTLPPVPTATLPPEPTLEVAPSPTPAVTIPPTPSVEVTLPPAPTVVPTSSPTHEPTATAGPTATPTLLPSLAPLPSLTPLPTI